MSLLVLFRSSGAASRLSASPGAFTITGSPVTMRRTLILPAAAGSFAITGSAALLKAARYLSAAAGSYTITGSDATLRKGVLFSASPGAFTITGSAVTFRRALRLVAEAGAFVLTGMAAVLRWTTPQSIAILLDGDDVTAHVDFENTEKEDELNDTPDTFSFTIYDVVPVEEQTIVVLRDIDTREFAGRVIKVVQFYDGIRHNIGYRVLCQDKTREFNRTLITRRWTATSGTTIAQQIVAYASGFTTTHIEAGLATLAEFEVVLKTPQEALRLLGNALGGVNFYIDYEASPGVHVFTVEATDAPDDIADLTKSGDALRHTADATQLRTRVKAVGAGASVTADAAVGQTSLPLQTGDYLASGGGKLLVAANIVDYTGKSANPGEGSTAVGPLGSPSTPTPTVSTTESGGPLGAVSYKRTDVYADGESELGSASSTVTPATVSTPSAISSGGGQHTNGGTYQASPLFDRYTSYVGVSRSGSSFTFTLANAVPGAMVRLSGGGDGSFDGTWRIASVSGSTCTVNGISTSAASSDTVYLQWVTTGPLDGTLEYGISLLSALGETAISNALSVTVAAAAGPSAGSGYGTETTGGSLTTGAIYRYWFSATGSDGETSPLQTSPVTLTGANNAVAFALPGTFFTTAFQDMRLTGFNVYRSRANGYSPFLLRSFSRAALAQLACFDNSGSTRLAFTDTSADSALGALPSNTPVGAAVGLWGITTTSDVRCTGRRLWRKIGSTWYPLALLGDRDTTTFYLDTTSNDELGRGSQGLDPRPFGGAAVNLAFSAGGAGVLSSNFYRTKASGSDYFYCGSVAAGATTYKDTKADEDLGREAPTHSKRRTPVGNTTLRVKDTTKFSSSGGWWRAGSAIGRYGGRSTSSGEGNLTSVPASGIGSILAPISEGVEVTVEPAALGIPASNTGSILYAITKGAQARIYVVRNDTSAQTDLAADQGEGDGVIESPLDDPSITTVTGLEEAADAELADFARRLKSITFRSRDPKLRSGKTITVNLGGTTNISGDYLIQRVVTTEMNKAPRMYPLRTVTAGPVLLNSKNVAKRRQLSTG